MEKNNIEKVIDDDLLLDLYLSEVSKEDFKKDIADLKSRYTNKELVKRMIEELQKLI